MPLSQNATCSAGEENIGHSCPPQSSLDSGRFFQVRARFRACFRAAAFIACCAAGSLWAQQPAPAQVPPDAPSATRSAESARQRRAPAGFFATLNRKSLFFPDIATTDRPLSTGEKFKLFVDDSASFSALLSSALSAGINQANDAPEGFGQGGEGYAKRFGASMARNASSNFFGSFVLASMLRQDPRFFPQADPTFGGSVKYALTRVVVTRNDDGDDVPNWSGLLGPLMAEGLANVYWPEEDRTAAHTFERYGLDLASRAGFNLLRNYWPVLFRGMRHASNRSAEPNWSGGGR